MRVIVVGARGSTSDLLRRLGERWDATVVDPDEDLLARASNVREIEQIVGFRFLTPPRREEAGDAGHRRRLLGEP